MLKPSLALAALMLTTAHAASAATVTHSSGTFDVTLDIFADPTGDFSFSTPTSVTGLQQFDPTLGTLTGVTFAVVSGDFTWTADLFGDPIPGALFDGEFDSTVQASLIYRSGTSGLVLNGIADTINLFCSGDESLGEGCNDSNSNTFDFAVDGFDVPRDLSEFSLADLVGTGDVANLELSLNLFGTSFLNNSGLDFIDASGFAEIALASVEVTYEYTTTVPVPAAAWLFGSGLIGLAGVARRRNA